MRIVFASLGSLGELHPLLALARASSDRGHSPVIAASETYRKYIASVGFDFCRIRPDLERAPARLEHVSHPRRGPERLLREEVFPRVRETYEDLIGAAREADFLVAGELLFVASLVAAKLGIPWTNVVLSPSSFLSAYDPCVLAPAPALHGLRHLGAAPHRLIFALGRFQTSRWSAPLRTFRQELGFPAGPNPVFDGKHAPFLVLALFPRFLAVPQLDWPPQVIQTGFPFFSQPCESQTKEKIDSFLASGEPPIVVTLGSSTVYIAGELYRSAIDAVRLLDRRAILLAGKNFSLVASPHQVLTIDYAPLESVLPRAAAVVHHGGIGTCAEALRAGIPSLIVPFGFDQPDNAERLRRLGVAKVLGRSRVSVGSLATNLRNVLENPSISARAREISAWIHPAADLAKAIDAIERIAGTHSGDPATLEPNARAT